MPELPDVENFRRYLTSKARGKKMIDVKFSGAKRVLRNRSPRQLERALQGHRFERTRRHGKHLFVKLDRCNWLAMHFGMTGFLAYFKSMKDAPVHSRMCIDFANGYHLAYVNQRKFGALRVISDPGDFIGQKELGPDALDRALDSNAFLKLISSRRGQIKPALMDQNVLAGIGNIYSDEILFQAKIHPKAPIGRLEKQQISRLHRTMRRVLRMAIRKGAGSDKLLERLPRGYLLPHRQQGALCPRCKGEVRTIKIAGRTAYYCPRCQRLPD